MYGANGKKVLHRHAKEDSHIKMQRIVEKNKTLPGAEPTAGQVDHDSDLKAITVAFAAENALPFSLVPSLLEYARRMAQNRAALNRITMSRTCATYYTTHGVGDFFRTELAKKLETSHFSINVDEATNNADNKIVNVLAQYYDEECKKIVVCHLGSKKVNLATSENILNGLTEVLDECKLKWENVISCLMDNCSTMRGIKGGVEVRARKLNPYLMDVSGDTVHMVTEAAKTFFTPFANYLEKFCQNVYYDIEESPKAKELLKEIQDLTNLETSRKNARGSLNLIRPIPNRFLQMLPVTKRISQLKEVLFVYYYAFLTEEEKVKFKPKLVELYKKMGVSTEAAARIEQIQILQAAQAKSSTSSSRKELILTYLFEPHGSTKFVVMLALYRGILELFEGFVKNFQADKPQIHKLHTEMFRTVQNFLAMFVKVQHMPSSPKDVLKLDVTDKSLHVQRPSVGPYALHLLNSARTRKEFWVQSFMDSLREGYIQCAKKLKDRLPLTNLTISQLSVLDPCMRKEESTVKAFVKMAEGLPNVVPQDILGKLEIETRRYCIDPDIDIVHQNYSKHCKENESTTRIDIHFWNEVFVMNKYGVLNKLVKALLTIFSGPLVESSFNIMDDIVESDQTAMTVENYQGVAIIKSSLRAKGIKATQLVCTPSLRAHCTKAYQRYQHHLKEEAELRKKKKQEQLMKAVVFLKDNASKHAKRAARMKNMSALVKQRMAPHQRPCPKSRTATKTEVRAPKRPKKPEVNTLMPSVKMKKGSAATEVRAPKGPEKPEVNTLMPSVEMKKGSTATEVRAPKRPKKPEVNTLMPSVKMKKGSAVIVDSDSDSD